VGRFSRDEVETAFADLFYTGCVAEDWTAWARRFTDDCQYVEHFWGRLRGRAEVELWIDPVMAGVPEIYTVLEWYIVDDDKVVWSLQNRRDNPDPDGPAYFDFPGLSVAVYAGRSRWSYEEDYWDVKGARDTARLYAAACEKMGTRWEARLSRRHWPTAGPSWARFEGKPAPSWLGMPGVRPITRPTQLREILAQRGMRTP
jgi:hypothetical protein